MPAATQDGRCEQKRVLGLNCAGQGRQQVDTRGHPQGESSSQGLGRAHLIQEEVRLLDLSQGVSEKAEHELLHLEPVHSPQLLSGMRQAAGMRQASSSGEGSPHLHQPDTQAQAYPLVLKEELLELRKRHSAELWPLPSPTEKRLVPTWRTDSRGPSQGRAQLPASMAHPSHHFPTCIRITQGRAPPPISKPNLKVLASKKGRSICRKQNLVRTEPWEIT